MEEKGFVASENASPSKDPTKYLQYIGQEQNILVLNKMEGYKIETKPKM
jgi:hypothetical protein